MDPSQKHAKEREFFDVHPGHRQGSGAKTFLKRFVGGRSRTVNLQPSWFRRYRRFLSAGIACATLIAALAAVRLFTRAEVQDFYPSICLGTWENAAGASGVPENFDPSLAVEGFTPENSAIYRLPESEVFCGGFLAPSEETEGNITNIALTFIWRAGELPKVPEPVGVVKTPPSTPEDAETTDASETGEVPPPGEPSGNTGATSSVPTDDATAHTPNESGSSTLKDDDNITPPDESIPPPAEQVPPAEPLPEPAPPSPEPVPSQGNEPSARVAPNFFSFILNRPFAQEDVTPARTEAPASSSEILLQNTEPPTPVPSTNTNDETSPNDTPTGTEPIPFPEEPVVLPTLTTKLEPIATSTTNETTSTPTGTAPTYEPPPPPEPDENFLKVSYSVDGEAWFEIGRVNMGNWQNFTARLPISRWDELKKLQISIQGIPTMLNPVPPVYLAGMFVEVNYELPPLFGDEQGIADESTENLPVLSAPNAIRSIPGRDEESVFGVGERV